MMRAGGDLDAGVQVRTCMCLLQHSTAQQAPPGRERRETMRDMKFVSRPGLRKLRQHSKLLMAFPISHAQKKTRQCIREVFTGLIAHSLRHDPYRCQVAMLMLHS